MRPLPFVYPYAVVFWVLYLAAFVPEFVLVRRIGRQRPGRQDRGSTQVIMVGNTMGVTLAFVCAFAVARATIAADRVSLFWAGTALIVAGALFRQHCFRALGASFKPIVDVRRDQQVVQRGAYRFVRHPSYAAGIVLFAGVGLALTNWVSILVILVMLAVVYGYRIRVEEAALLSTLGDSYRDYMRRTKRLVPFVW